MVTAPFASQAARLSKQAGASRDVIQAASVTFAGDVASSPRKSLTKLLTLACQRSSASNKAINGPESTNTLATARFAAPILREQVPRSQRGQIAPSTACPTEQILAEIPRRRRPPARKARKFRAQRRPHDLALGEAMGPGGAIQGGVQLFG
jgi:hypothetical protein